VEDGTLEVLTGSHAGVDVKGVCVAWEAVDQSLDWEGLTCELVIGFALGDLE
jgi:hypothetical protein